MRTAESVMLTCWPPAPEERKVSMRRSSGRISILISSSTCGYTKTEANDVWRRAFALQAVGDDGLEAVALGPAQVHAQQHFGPVLAFGTAGAGVNRDDGAPAIVFAGEKHLGFEALQQFAVGLEVALDVAVDVLAFAREFE